MLHGEAEKTREQLLARLSEIRPIDPEIAIEYELITGDPVTRILAVAQAFECDLIVMGTHGRTGLTHLLMGSVAERVMRRAPCPLLTVKIPLPGISLRQLGALAVGEVIVSDWPASEEVPLYASNVALSWGEFEVVEGSIAVRLTRLG